MGSNEEDAGVLTFGLDPSGNLEVRFTSALPEVVVAAPGFLGVADQLATAAGELFAPLVRDPVSRSPVPVDRREAVQTLGRRLWASLPEKVARRFQEWLAVVDATAGRHTLAIVAGEAEVLGSVHALPWELLWSPQAPTPLALVPRLAVVRRTVRAVPSVERDLLPPAPPLRILMVVASPDDLVDRDDGLLDFEQEERALLEALLPAIANGTVQLEVAEAGDLQAPVKTCSASPPSASAMRSGARPGCAARIWPCASPPTPWASTRSAVA